MDRLTTVRRTTASRDCSSSPENARLAHHAMRDQRPEIGVRLVDAVENTFVPRRRGLPASNGFPLAAPARSTAGCHPQRMMTDRVPRMILRGVSLWAHWDCAVEPVLTLPHEERRTWRSALRQDRFGYPRLGRPTGLLTWRPRRLQGAPNVLVHRLGRRRLRDDGRVRRPGRDADHAPHRRAGRALLELPHDGAVLADAASSLLTGRNATSNGMATIAEFSSGFPGISTRIPFENGFISEVLAEQRLQHLLRGQVAPHPG